MKRDILSKLNNYQVRYSSYDCDYGLINIAAELAEQSVINYLNIVMSDEDLGWKWQADSSFYLPDSLQHEVAKYGYNEIGELNVDVSIFRIDHIDHYIKYICKVNYFAQTYGLSGFYLEVFEGGYRDLG